MQSGDLKRLLAAARSGRSAILVTDLGSGEQLVIEDDGQTGTLSLIAADRVLVDQAVAAERSGIIEASDGKLFVEIWTPPLRMILVGAVHIAQMLVPMAVLAGYRVSIVDPRSAFTAGHRFGGAKPGDVTLINDWPDAALAGLSPDKQTAIVTLTHDPKIDDPALQAALRSAAFYIGSLGSRRTHAQRLDRLREAGFEAADLARIHGPVGLNIGALTPAEIAVSILAEIIATLRAARLKQQIPS